ncbi:MAG TPA: protein kinase, partial [Polyangiaceae bacterium]
MGGPANDEPSTPPPVRDPDGLGGGAEAPDGAGDDALDPLVGSTIAGKYTLVRALGRGGMGAVYEARTASGEAFALKLIRPDVHDSRGRDAVRRFLREAKAAQAIVSPYVARVVDAGADEERKMPFLVMELLRGRDLARLLAAQGPLEPGGAVPFFAQVCEGLAAAHAQGVIHRDIKPANLFVQDLPDGEIAAKVCDFGVAKQVVAGEPGTELTQSGGVIGSPMYMSPEQARNAKNVDLRTDVFSVAVSLYEALTGQRPWQGTTMGELILAMGTTPPPRIDVVAPWISRALAEAIHKALARSPENRLASAAEFAAALRAVEPGPLVRAALRGISEEKRRALAAIPPSAWSETAVASTMAGGTAGLPPLTPPADSRRPSTRRFWAAAVLAATVGALAVAFGTQHRLPAHWWSGERAVVAVPLGTTDPRAPCAAWVPAAVTEGLSSQLTAGGEFRAVGMRELAGLAPQGGARPGALRAAIGADAVIETTCRPGMFDRDAVEIQARVLSAEDPPHELGSVSVSGTMAKPSALVAELAKGLRSALGMPALEATEAARALRTLPQTAELTQAYVEGLEKQMAFDPLGAEARLRRVTTADPEFAPAHAVLAAALAYRGQVSEAATESSLAAKNSAALPNEVRLLLDADAAFAENAWDKAIEDYGALLKVFPDRTDVALKLIRTYVQSARPKEARPAIDALLARSSSRGDPRVFVWAAQTALMSGDDAGAREALQHARDLAHQWGFGGIEATATMLECVVLPDATKLEEADAVCAKALSLEEASGDKSGIVNVLSRDAYRDSVRGNVDAARGAIDRALALAANMGNHRVRAQVLIDRGNFRKIHADLPGAIADAREAAKEADEAGANDLRISARSVLAGALLDSGDTTEAPRVYEEALALCRKSGSDKMGSVVLQNLSIYSMNVG